MQGDSQLVGEFRVRCLAQGHLDTQLGGSMDRTSDLAVTSQPALPPELLWPDLLTPTSLRLQP